MVIIYCIETVSLNIDQSLSLCVSHVVSQRSFTVGCSSRSLVRFSQSLNLATIHCSQSAVDQLVGLSVITCFQSTGHSVSSLKWVGHFPGGEGEYSHIKKTVVLVGIF